MAQLTGRADIFKRMAKGQGYSTFTMMGAPGNPTGGSTNSGFYTMTLMSNNIGTTEPNTKQTIPLPTGLTRLRIVEFYHANNNVGQNFLARFYKLGTLNLAATGDQFTHDSATFPLLRTQFGAASQPVTLIPLLQISTATTTTAAQLQLQTNAGAAGYTNQDGSTVIGGKTFILPSATTAIHSTLLLWLNDGDTGVQDINQIKVAVAAAAGAANVWGMEVIAASTTPQASTASADDLVFSGLSLQDILPAAPTSGTLTSFLGVINLNSQISSTGTEVYLGAVSDS